MATHFTVTVRAGPATGRAQFAVLDEGDVLEDIEQAQALLAQAAEIETALHPGGQPSAAVSRGTAAAPLPRRRGLRRR